MAGSSRDAQLIELKDSIKMLNTTIGNLNSMLEESKRREQELLARISNLQEQNDYLQKKLFGHSSEKRDDIEGQRKRIHHSSLSFKKEEGYHGR